nr:hypothetical protein [Bacteroidota bacterium]
MERLRDGIPYGDISNTLTLTGLATLSGQVEETDLSGFDEGEPDRVNTWKEIILVR